ncbi:MAG: metalloregulator ArsR/SmtB family transcription factor [Bacteroidetes bacterium]|jgi:DNA-binding transcriptional ArsR family regulator|nr:metalloregulator ArsR/SmtB family transcription factor [Bacteroidota bacterium]MDF1865887.1 metalloregulator ArsR/SmtB family transcription factor [Saprospiraceae bacterium]
MIRRGKVEIDDEKLQAASHKLRALAHPLRMRILEMIHHHKEIGLNNLLDALNLEQSLTSVHLHLLRIFNMVIVRREGTVIYYTINLEEIRKCVNAVNRFLEEE